MALYGVFGLSCLVAVMAMTRRARRVLSRNTKTPARAITGKDEPS